MTQQRKIKGHALALAISKHLEPRQGIQGKSFIGWVTPLAIKDTGDTKFSLCNTTIVGVEPM
jgi:hypothetical protein